MSLVYLPYLASDMLLNIGYAPDGFELDRWRTAGRSKQLSKIRYCLHQKIWFSRKTKTTHTSYYCTYADMRSGHWYSWKSDEKQELLTEAERAELFRIVEKRKREAEAKAKAEALKAAKTAKFLWNKASKPNPNHPYLLKKRIKGYGARQLKDNLLIPVRNIENELVGLQVISPDGSKRFLTGTPKKGSFMVMGESPSKLGQAQLVEGYATGCSLLEVHGGAVVVCFDCHNVEHLTEVFLDKYPDVNLSVVTDDDRETMINGVQVNSGRNIGQSITERFPSVYVFRPSFPECAPTCLTDVNDVHCWLKDSNLPVTHLFTKF
jgi:putative DNA primase/helicase